MTLHVFGVRHHGPGCARALRAALEQLAPDIVLVEGPPDANETLTLLSNERLRPPLALLVHAVDDPQNSSFYPFAEFSPEWQALSYAAARRIPARFMDLPCANSLAIRGARARDSDSPENDHAESVGPNGPQPTEDTDSIQGPSVALPERLEALRDDPIGILAEAAGFSDHEQWWDVQVEQRQASTGLFEALLEAMKALREGRVEPRRERQREAHMRQTIRAAQKEGFQRIAIVCGAWHAPVLAELGPAKPDLELLKGLPKTKVAATWIPWTYSRLSFRSGYGAGVDSPGWYGHLWEHGEKAAVVWATLAARLLRGEDLDASAANVIETVRLADTLASLRELPNAGLTELREAIEAVLCGGDKTRLSLIRNRLEIGDALGEVPDGVGQVPLMRDFEREAKRLRLKLTTQIIELDLDLRKDNDRDRSRLLHRLNVLGVEWGKPASSRQGMGTFREGWEVAWQPELAVDLIAANLRGNTIELAATRALTERAGAADLPELSRLLELALIAHLPASLDTLLHELDARAATSSDVRLQMEAILPLSRLVRYGDVRATRAELVLPVLKALFERIVVGLSAACTQLDDDAAAQMVAAIGQAHSACSLLDDAELKRDWLSALRDALDKSAAHARIRGRVCRLLIEQQELAEPELAERASLALSPGVEPAEASRWVEGLVAGEGLSLVHQEQLLGSLDAWLQTLDDSVFQAQLPLLRRAFSGLTGPERRAVAQRVKHGPKRGRARPVHDQFEPERAARIIPIFAALLGVTYAAARPNGEPQT
ncbi:MAG TPA: DUF5682 family protein [Polyangiaceae bacterium]|nr:DUF5682 family protein [Polyangiaceae bacterium]